MEKVRIDPLKKNRLLRLLSDRLTRHFKEKDVSGVSNNLVFPNESALLSHMVRRSSFDADIRVLTAFSEPMTGLVDVERAKAAMRRVAGNDFNPEVFERAVKFLEEGNIEDLQLPPEQDH